MPKLLHRCMTKATTADGETRRYGPNWLLSRRGVLKVFDDHLECGSWRIEYPEITSAVLYSFRSTILRIPGYVLTVETAERAYHFGLNGWGRFWEGELPFHAERQAGTLGFTWFSIAIRVALASYVAYAAWQWLNSR